MLTFQPVAGHALSFDSTGTDVGSEIVTTRHTTTVHGTPLAYTARAGFIPLLDEAAGEVHAKIFFVSYTVEPNRGSPARPLTFYTAGGPGESATLEAFGPRSLKDVKVQEHLPPPPYEMVDNQETWLTFTDLVLIDPVGTGYSRATRPEYAAQYYNRDGDAESIAQFIQLYLQRYEPTMRQPIFVGGVSYGSIRTALIADIASRRGIPLRGLILTSSALANQPRLDNQPRLSDLSYALQLPTFTATAFFHKKLSPDLQRNFDEALEQAESWAANEYPKLLAQGDALSGDQLRTAAVEMARLTGLSPEVVLYNRFRFLPDAFLRELLGADWTPAGLYDSRRLKADQAASGIDKNWNPVLSSLYLGGELHFRSEFPYADFIETWVNVHLHGWHCGPSGDNDCTAAPQALVKLQRAMRENHSLRVMITNGYYDLDCPYFGTKRAISQLEPDLISRVSITYYKTGHMPPPEHREEVARFIQKVSTISRKTGSAHVQSVR